MIIKEKNDLEKWIKAVGEEIIDRASDVARDSERVSSITITSEIIPDKILNLDINKNYIVKFDYIEKEN